MSNRTKLDNEYYNLSYSDLKANLSSILILTVTTNVGQNLSISDKEFVKQELESIEEAITCSDMDNEQRKELFDLSMKVRNKLL